MVNALLPTPPAEKTELSLQLVWLVGPNVYGDRLKNSPKDQTLYGRTAKQHRVSRLPPTTTSLYSVMAYKGQTSRDCPSTLVKSTAFPLNIAKFLLYKVVWPATQPAHGK